MLRRAYAPGENVFNSAAAREKFDVLVDNALHDKRLLEMFDNLEIPEKAKNAEASQGFRLNRADDDRIKLEELERTRAALLHLPTIEKGRQPMTATEEELDYEISEEEHEAEVWKTRFDVPDDPEGLRHLRKRRRKIAIAVSAVLAVLIIVAIALFAYFGASISEYKHNTG